MEKLSYREDLPPSRENLATLKTWLSHLERELEAIRREREGLRQLAGPTGTQAGEDGTRRNSPMEPAISPPGSPPRAFSSRRGELLPPTGGEITRSFGGKTPIPSRTILYNSGVVITAPKGQEIRAVHDGTVMFADWFKEYGKVMIIDHGDHYYSLVAHVDQLYKNVGQTVREGEAIATVGETGSLGKPGLYFEIRHHGKPVDPTQWLAVRKSSKE